MDTTTGLRPASSNNIDVRLHRRALLGQVAGLLLQLQVVLSKVPAESPYTQKRLCLF